MNNPFVSFIVVTYTGVPWLRDCLESLCWQKDAEVILVNNGATFSLEPFIPKELESRLKIIKDAVNVGYARAGNQGIELAQGEWIVLLNDDVVLDRNFLEELKKIIERYARFRVFSPLVLIRDFPDYVDSAGLGVFLDGSCRCRGWQEPKNAYLSPSEVLGPVGSVAIWHRDVIREVGLLDPDYFLYLEDLDYALRCQWQGFPCLYAPELIAWHVRSSTVGKHTPQKAFLIERNHTWVAAKNFPLAMLFFVPFFTFYRYLFQAYAALSKKGITGNFVRSYSR